MSATPQDKSQPAKADPFAHGKPPPGAITDDDEAEFGQSLAAKALAFSSMAPPLRGAPAAPTPAAPAAAAAPRPTPPVQHEPAVRIPGSPSSESAVESGGDDEIFGGSNLAAAALKYADQAPPLRGAPSSFVPTPAAAPTAPRRSIDEPPPLERSAPARSPVRVHGNGSIPEEAPPLMRSGSAPAQGADGECRIAVSRDGIKELWDVVFPGGGGAVIILTPRRSYPGDSRVLAAHISWRAADAVATSHAAAFARVLAKASNEAETFAAGDADLISGGRASGAR